MTKKSLPQTDENLLEIAIDRDLPVSSFSSLLRVVQAALREVARSNDDTREPFSRQRQPVLVVSTATRRGDLILLFSFIDPSDSTPLSRLSARTFGTFMEELSRLLKTPPQQRGLWGESVGSARRRDYESEVARRADQVRLELRRFPKSRLTFSRQTISFEGDRMVIE